MRVISKFYSFWALHYVPKYGSEGASFKKKKKEILYCNFYFHIGRTLIATAEFRLDPIRQTILSVDFFFLDVNHYSFLKLEIHHLNYVWLNVNFLKCKNNLFLTKIQYEENSDKCVKCREFNKILFGLTY